MEIDTAHFKGNFPESCEIHATTVTGEIDWSRTRGEDGEWSLILPRTKLGPHRQHHFQLENVEGNLYTHVKVTIHPDGGIKRVRIIGTKGGRNSHPSEVKEDVKPAETLRTAPSVRDVVSSIPVLPLTPEAFAPFGQVVQAYGDLNAAPKGIKITPANQGSASKYHKLSLLASSYPPEAGATAGLSVYRCKPLEGVSNDGIAELKVMERHPCTNQAFIPMGRGSGEGLADPGTAYLVVCAKNATDGQPDLSTVRAFVATAAQGIMYNMRVWRECFVFFFGGDLSARFSDRSTHDSAWEGASYQFMIATLSLMNCRPWILLVLRLRWEMGALWTAKLWSWRGL